MSRTLRFDWLARRRRRSLDSPHRRQLRIEKLEERRLLAGLVGVDFGTGSSPTNWAQISFVPHAGAPANRTNMIDDTGAATAVDFSISTSFSGGAGSFSANITPGTLPQHTPSIANVNGIVFVDSADGAHSFNATWSDLKPGFNYEVYVFGLESTVSGTPFVDNQSVTISGGSPSIQFVQNPLSLGNLWVNDQIGSSSQPLENYRKLIKPSAAGQIQITIQMLGGSDSLVLAGLAIREVGIIVNSVADTDDMNPNNGVTTLREAVRLSNTYTGADTITFADNLSGQTILLGGTEMAISSALTIDARSLAQNVTIDARQLSRIFNITATSGDFTLAGLTLTGGQTTAAGFPDGGGGGAIRSETSDLLTLRETTVSASKTIGDQAHGGGIFARGSITLAQSTVSGNSTSGGYARGGGIHAYSATLTETTVSYNFTSGRSAYGGGMDVYSATLTETTVSDNMTFGSDAGGGGIKASSITLNRSTISDNQTWGNGAGAGGGGMKATHATLTQSTVSGNVTFGRGAFGGGIDMRASLAITESTISDNETWGDYAQGGGIFSLNTLTIAQSTISGNRTVGLNASGAGISAIASVELTRSTVTDNHADGPGAVGGGLRQTERFVNNPLSITGSIIAGNTAASGSPDLAPDPQSLVANSVNYSLIGNTSDSGVTGGTGTGNLLNVNPQLRPLGDYGGPTLTHGLLVGSPAIDAGNPALVYNPAQFDQRGASFTRVLDGRVDMGAVEGAHVDTTSDVVDGNYAPGQLSLREAIGLANAHDGDDTISFLPTMSGQTIRLTGGELPITDSLAIDAVPLARNVTIDAHQASRIFRIDDPNTTTEDFAVTLAGLNLVGGRTTTSGQGGGAILSLSTWLLTLNESSVGGSSTTGQNSGGGGIYALGDVTLNASTISGNSTAGQDSGGGGVFVDGSITLNQSTITGNSTTGPSSIGGGLRVNRSVTINHSTITGNSVSGAGSVGGGLRKISNEFDDPITIEGSILAGNTSAGTGPDIVRDGQSIFTANYSLLGTAINPNAGDNNIANNNPLLAALADNGGPTFTRAPLAESPVIDVGNPAAVAGGGGIPFNDQRGAPFGRVVDGDGVPGARIDIGAVEKQPIAPAILGDYNLDGTVDAADYVVFRDRRGSSAVAYSGADGSGNGIVDQDDYYVWRDHFGQILPAEAVGAGSGSASVMTASIDSSEEEPFQSLEVAAIARAADAVQAARSVLFGALYRQPTSSARAPARLHQFLANDSDNDLLLLAADQIGRFSGHVLTAMEEDSREDACTKPAEQSQRTVDHLLTESLAELQ